MMRFKWEGLEDCPVRIFIKRQFLKTINEEGFVVSTKIDITRAAKRVRNNGKHKFFCKKNQKIADLEAKLAESEEKYKKAYREGLLQKQFDKDMEIEQLKQQLAEKEKEIKQLKEG